MRRVAPESSQDASFSYSEPWWPGETCAPRAAHPRERPYLTTADPSPHHHRMGGTSSLFHAAPLLTSPPWARVTGP